jgi:hypothetical protein
VPDHPCYQRISKIESKISVINRIQDNGLFEIIK